MDGGLAGGRAPAQSWEPGALPKAAERSRDSLPAPQRPESPGHWGLEPLKPAEMPTAGLRNEHPLCEEGGGKKKVSSFVFLSCLP